MSETFIPDPQLENHSEKDAEINRLTQVNLQLKSENNNLLLEKELINNKISALTKKHNRYKKLIKFRSRIKNTSSQLISQIKSIFKRISLGAILSVLTLFFIGIEAWILLGQNKIMQFQNGLLEGQNQRFDQQNQLIEAERRSSYVFLLGNIMDAVNTEIGNSQNTERRISPQLRGEIIALSNSLTPYHFVSAGELTEKPYSPERGILLVFLIQAKINPKDLDTIFLDGEFSSLFLSKLAIKDAKFNLLSLQGASIEELILGDSEIGVFECFSCKTKTVRVFNTKAESLLFNNVEDLYLSSLDSDSIQIISSNISIGLLDNVKTKFLSFITPEISTLNNKNVTVGFYNLSIEKILSLDFSNSNIKHMWINGTQTISEKGTTYDNGPYYVGNIEGLSILDSKFVNLNSNATIINLQIMNSIILSVPIKNKSLNYNKLAAQKVIRITDSTIPVEYSNSYSSDTTFNYKGVSYAVFLGRQRDNNIKSMMDLFKGFWNQADSLALDYQYITN